MTIIELPDSPQSLAQATWDDIRPFYDNLQSYPLNRSTVEGWLTFWSNLEELLTEAANLAYIAHTTDTNDTSKAANEGRFSTEIWPQAEERRVQLSARLLDLSYTRPDLETMLRRFRNRQELFRASNVPLVAALAALDTRYLQLIGGLSVAWDGEVKTRAQLRPYALSNERGLRERAFRAHIGTLVEHRDELADIFDRQLALRQTIAQNAGYANYRDYAHREQGRFDYTPADCARFHASWRQPSSRLSCDAWNGGSVC